MPRKKTTDFIEEIIITPAHSTQSLHGPQTLRTRVNNSRWISVLSEPENEDKYLANIFGQHSAPGSDPVPGPEGRYMDVFDAGNSSCYVLPYSLQS